MAVALFKRAPNSLDFLSTALDVYLQPPGTVIHRNHFLQIGLLEHPPSILVENIPGT